MPQHWKNQASELRKGNREGKAIIVKVINTFKHDSRAVLEQRLLDNLVELCGSNTAGLQVYVHADLIGKFIDWLNENNREVAGNGYSVSWKVKPLDAAALLDIKESDNVFPLLVDRKKIGYAKGLEQQLHYQSLLTQVFPPRSLRGWHI